jgi:hypothetical protein
MSEKSTPIITDAGASGKRVVGSVLHLADALELYPEKSLILYNRTSGYGRQSGHNNSKLDEKERVLYRTVRKMTDRPLCKVVSVAGERGKLDQPRRDLIRAAKAARKLNAMVVAYDLSRLLRPENYDCRTNPNAEPTPSDLERLHDLTGGVVLATFVPPWLTESERHSLATKRTGNAGRPCKIPMERIPEVFAALGALGMTPDERLLWQNPIRSVAKEFGVSCATIQKIITDNLDTLSPDGTRTYREVAHNAAIACRMLDANGCPHLPPLTRTQCYQMRRADFWTECGYKRYDGELDMRYRQNRSEGRRADGEPDRRYRRNRDDHDK